MKRYRNGRVYDTEKATLVAASRKKRACLYRKKVGEYFLFEEADERDTEGTITPISYGEAKSWLSKQVGKAAAEKEFGRPDMSEDAPTLSATYKVKPITKMLIDRECKIRGITRGQVVDELARSLDTDSIGRTAKPR